jgi:hypothetical protein
MLFIILVIIIVAGFIYALKGEKGLNRNERLYLKRRGYEPPAEVEERPQVSKDTRLFSAIESLSDVSAFARQRAAEDLARMCESGNRDPRMLSALISALNDNDASVRSAAAIALGKLGNAASIAALTQRMDIEESIHVRASIEKAIELLTRIRTPAD